MSGRPILILALSGLTLPTVALGQVNASGKHYPGVEWRRISSLEDAGWSKAGLDVVRAYADSVGSMAYMIIDDGLLVDAWGETARREVVQSVRKSFLSALYGIYVAEAQIDLAANLEQLGIDDRAPSLTRAEKQATVRHLLQARSGVYHWAAASPRGMIRNLPKRGSHAAGTFWYYNNWDFNALGTIFERETGQGIFDAFYERIARPLQMQDFRSQDGWYQHEPISDHPAYHFFMTARDMARFGLLYLREGEWNGVQIVPRAWIRESTSTHSHRVAGDYGYGYMWWTRVRTRSSYRATGGNGHMILVIPEQELVIVHRVPMRAARSPNWDNVERLTDLILAARY